MGVTIGFAFGGSAAVTLFWTMWVEKSSSVALDARWSTMTGFRASGAIVATYWSVLVTVRIAHTEITETGMRSDASTTSTHAEIRRVRGARCAFFFGASGCSGSPGAASTGWSASISLIWLA